MEQSSKIHEPAYATEESHEVVSRLSNATEPSIVRRDRREIEVIRVGVDAGHAKREIPAVADTVNGPFDSVRGDDEDRGNDGIEHAVCERVGSDEGLGLAVDVLGYGGRGSGRRRGRNEGVCDGRSDDCEGVISRHVRR